MKGDDISERLIAFAVCVLRVVDSLPKSVVGRHVGLQLARSATSAGANYEEGRGAESLADFVHKVGIAWKESRESLFWLKVIHRSKLVKPQRLEHLLKECDELCAILAASLATSRKRSAKSHRERVPHQQQNESPFSVPHLSFFILRFLKAHQWHKHQPIAAS